MFSMRAVMAACAALSANPVKPALGCKILGFNLI
jgi:hypothetical protein